MYAEKSHDFNGCVSSNAGMSSGETGDPTLVEIDEKLVLDEALSRMERHVRISDLVWCKDMGQPWWPGKVIGDSIMLTDSDESFESDIYLVVCFGDRSTAWHRVSCVKPFWENFPRLVKRSDIGSFRKAVDCALEEVSRRIKYTLTCRCLPKQIHVDFGRPFWGVSCEDKREAVLSTTSFVPRELVNYLQASSVAASGCDNRLVLEVTIAQLSAFFCWRAHSQELPLYSSLFAAIYSDSDNNFTENSVQKDNDIMDFYRPDKGTGSFPSSQNTSSMGGYAAYINVTMNVSLSPPDNDEKGKFPAETDYSGDISTPTIPMEKLGECVGESEEKNYATSLHMIFTDWNLVPSEADLHETFGRFGQLIELETKLYPKSMAARIVFQERSAAEAAFGIVRETLPSVVSFKLKLLRLKPEKSSRGRKRQRESFPPKVQEVARGMCHLTQFIRIQNNQDYISRPKLYLLNDITFPRVSLARLPTPIFKSHDSYENSKLRS